jgi:hypothetical protein
MREKKRKYYEYITKRECPFKPEINAESKKIMNSSAFKNEEREKLKIYERLSKIRKKNEISKPKNSLNEINIDIKEKEKEINKIKIKIKNRNRNINKNKNKNKISYSDTERNKRVRTKITIREKKFEDEIYKTLNDLSNKNLYLRKSFNQKFKENVGKYKLNNLKEIFEVIFNKCNSLLDIQNLGNFGISDNMKDNVILPTLHIIQSKKLDFNFQNFYLISNEIINNTS